MSLQDGLVVIGIDVGTSGVRVVAASVTGTLLAETGIPLSSTRSADGSKHEQDPLDWWKAVCECLRRALAALRLQPLPIRIAGIAVTSTSGSLVLADKDGQPLRPAILYDDNRSAVLAHQLNLQMDPTAMRLNASLSLTKAAWVQKEEPSVWRQVRYVLHPTDWLTGQLTGEFGVSDTSNVLKLGYEPDKEDWNRAVWTVGLSREQLPTVVSPGKPVGFVCSKGSMESGLPVGTPVLAGATDGMAGLIASGANQFGHANTTLGTTLVWKVLAKCKPVVSRGIYCHFHPSGAWVPGAASNTGPGSLRTGDPSISVPEMDQFANPELPTDLICYLLSGRGERFPFENPQAETFFERDPQGQGEWYAAQLQAIGFVERWGYEVIEKCGVPIPDVVFSTGGAAKSPILSQLRTDILNRTVVRCLHPNAAFGACILAASGTFYSGDIRSAIQRMTVLCESYRPSTQFVGRYNQIYSRFREVCARRGYK
jgi:sugar (pentulose or hexulose) kinase